MADNKKKLLTAVSVFSIVCIAVIIALGILLSAKSDKSEPKTCTTKACISAANLILNNIDLEKDPCEDFNQFSCGNFIKNRRIPDDGSTSTDTFTDLRNNLALALSDALSESKTNYDTVATLNAKKFYKSCLDENEIETNGEKNFLEVLNNDLGGSSLTLTSYDVSKEDTFEKLVKFGKMGLKPLFDFYVSSNPKAPELYVIRLQQPGWFLSKSSYTTEKVETAYKNLMTQIFSYLNPKMSNVNEVVTKMYSMEKEIVDFTLSVDQKRNQTYQNFTINDLNTKYQGFKWSEFLVDNILKDFKESLNINGQEPILVVDFAYFEKFVEFYGKAINDRKDDLHNLLIWSFIKSRTSYLPKKYRDAQLEFDKVSSGSSSIAPRSRTCANAIQDRMAYAVGRLYVRKNFDENAKKAATEMIENIRSEFIIMLDENSWMDRDSKIKAKQKAEAIDTKIGYPDYSYNDTYLDKLYERYNFDEKKYLQNALQVTKEDSRKAFADLRTKRDTKDWITGPAIVNAFYSSTNNQISFPAGILQAPFYDANFPKYLNYGGIGSVIGHEITHGFDDQGRRYDKNGVFFADGEVGLWTEQTIKNYKEKAQCIVDQYSNYTAKQINEKVRGFQTQGENIADNGGIKESFRAYKRWVNSNGEEPLLPGLNYTPEQLFFINYAQVWCLKITDGALRNRIETGVHSPGEFRIRGPTSNFDSFAKAFGCKANTANNPNKKCSVW